MTLNRSLFGLKSARSASPEGTHLDSAPNGDKLRTKTSGNDEADEVENQRAFQTGKHINTEQVTGSKHKGRVGEGLNRKQNRRGAKERAGLVQLLFAGPDEGKWEQLCVWQPGERKRRENLRASGGQVQEV